MGTNNQTHYTNCTSRAASSQLKTKRDSCFFIIIVDSGYVFHSMVYNMDMVKYPSDIKLCKLTFCAE